VTRRFVHLVNPAKVPPSSDLHAAQPVTFESIRRARQVAEGQVEVRLLSAQYPEDDEIIPGFFDRTPHLQRSILDLGAFHPPRKLPLIQDIIDRLRDHAGDADFLIYSNADIALMPGFYVAVDRLLDEGADALIINRRTIRPVYTKAEDIELMYAQAGRVHPGFDCIVFTPQVASRIQLHELCVGIPRFYRGLCLSVAAFAQKLAVYRDLHLTFHLGNDMIWVRRACRQYARHNRDEYLKVLRDLEQQIGPIRNHAAAHGMRLESSVGWLVRELTRAGLRGLHDRVGRWLTWI
jgi:hypothetical protein